MAFVDGYHTLEQISWPVPVRLEVRRWHADATVTQLCFNCGWQRPSQAVKILETQIHQTLEAFKVSPAYAEFKQFHGNVCLYTANAEKLQPTDDFIAQCRVVVDAEYPDWTEVNEWRYGSNDDGWTVLLKRKEST
jgi:hypothetical protein